MTWQRWRVPRVGLSTLPLESENFHLNKRKFCNVLSLRYRWTLKYLPSTYTRGKRFEVDYALTCMKDWFLQRRHDKVREKAVTSFWLGGSFQKTHTQPSFIRKVRTSIYMYSWQKIRSWSCIDVYERLISPKEAWQSARESREQFLVRWLFSKNPHPAELH